MRIAVIGATGILGKHIIPRLIELCHKDRLLAGERFYYDLRTLLKQLGINNYAELNLM